MTARETAAKAVMEITDKKVPEHIAVSFVMKANREQNRQERAFIKRLIEGTVERLVTIDFLLGTFSKTPLKKMKPWLRAVLRTAVYQILYMDSVPESAACNEAVKLAKKYGFTNLGGFVNGVLRSIIRDKDTVLEKEKEKSSECRLMLEYSLPVWLIRQWVRDFGEETAEKIAAAQFLENPLSVRCNLSRCTKEELKKCLEEDGVRTEDARYVKDALRITDCDGIETLYAFRKGYFQIQDESSMLVGYAAGLKGDETVLDLCAAPGGKTLHIADILKNGTVEARDVSEGKLELIRQNIERSGFGNIVTKCADATVFDETAAADVVIADVPCSGTGVTGRKADIKYNMDELKQKELVVLQRKILKNAVRYVKPGGTLIFSTCTLNSEENEGGRQYLRELGMQPDSLLPYLGGIIEADTLEAGYVQLIPGVYDTDGFYIARFRKPGENQNE